MVNYKGCRFKVEKCKWGTSWVVCWDELKITNSFTLENSFYGYSYGQRSNTVTYTWTHYEDIGKSLGFSLYELHGLTQQIDMDAEGWLKPGQLTQFTGVPKAELIANEYTEMKKKEQK